MHPTPAAGRQRQIIVWVDAGRDLSVSAMAAEFGVTTETVRRDLKSLEQDGRIRRVYGGAIPIGRHAPPLEDRQAENAAGKRAIADLVAPFVVEDQDVYLSSGSTVLAVAQKLASGPRLHVMTHMLKIAEVMGASGRHAVEMTGGFYKYSAGNLVGQAVPEAVTHRNFDLAIVGVLGLDLDFGVVDQSDYLFELKRRLKNRSRRSIWVASHEKFGRAGRFRTIPFDDLDVLVTDREPQEAYRLRLEEAGVEVLWPNRMTGAEPRPVRAANL